MAKKSTFKIPKTFTIGRVGDILTKRPDNMSYKVYRELRAQQTQQLKSRLEGFVIWKSKAVMKRGKDGSIVSLGENWGTATRDMLPVVQFK